MNEKILRIMSLALEISPYNKNLVYTSKSRVKLEYLSDFLPALTVTVTRCYKRRSTVTKEIFSRIAIAKQGLMRLLSGSNQSRRRAEYV